MKAVFYSKYGPPEVLQVREVEKPVPKDNEVLIKIKATTVTVADFRVRSFTVPIGFWLPARIMLGITKPKRPVLGSELSGEIEAVGKKVTRFKKGDEVFANTLPHFGAYAEYICFPEEGKIAIKPSNISHEAAALPIGALTATHFLKLGEIGPGQKVLIYGASGSVGTYAVQLAKYFGAEVTGVCSEGNFELVRSLGADKVIDYKATNWTQQLEMYDLFFVAVDKCPFSICNKHLKPKGVYLNITAPLKSPSMIWTSMTTDKKIIVGEDLPTTSEDLTYLKELVEAGSLKPVIDQRYPLDEIVEAHRYVDKGHKKGNVLITV